MGTVPPASNRATADCDPGGIAARNGRPEAVLVAVADLEALEETLDLLSSPAAIEQIRQAESDLAAGEGVDADELRRQLAARADR